MRTAAVLLAITALASLSGAGLASAEAPQTTVTVGNNFFSPTAKTVSRGTKVLFRWVGGLRHNVAKAEGPGGSIESGPTAKRGVNLAKRLRRSGTYRFICRIHPTEMRLKLVVR
jgi:plastocyanin